MDLATCQAAYLANADYIAEQSTAKAGAFLTACNQLLVLLPTSIAHGGAGSLQWSVESIAARLDAAERWLSSRLAAGSAGCVRYSSFEEFR
jgi:hypothetical protein